ncbi:hypothetical protein C8J56DRAFT_937202 [Mycena floridula]|nr:hypothetical protein C8J56DRAFT_937202 [Mycena floridula]
MKFSSVLAALTSLAVVSATPAARASCAEASRFGDLTVVPTDLTVGASFTIHVDLSCAINNFDIVPKFLDYSLVVPSNVNNGHEPPIVLARRTFTPPSVSNPGAFDTFSAQIPFYDGYFAGASYNIQLTTTYPQNATVEGEPDVLIQGGVFSPINLIIS